MSYFIHKFNNKVFWFTSLTDFFIATAAEDHGYCSVKSQRFSISSGQSAAMKCETELMFAGEQTV